MKIRVLALTGLLMFSLLFSPPTQSRDDGIFDSAHGCSCHNPAGSLTPTLDGYPSEYTPGSTYTINISSLNPIYSTGGFSLQVNKGELINPGTMVDISSNKLSATHNDIQRNSWQVDWTAPSAGSGSVTLSVAVINANGLGTNKDDVKGTLSVQITEFVDSNTPPSVHDVQISPSNPSTTDDLSVSYTFDDDDGDAESGTVIQWFKNGVLESSLSSSIVPSSATSRGEEWTVAVTPSDGTASGQQVTSSATTITNSLPYSNDITILPQQPTTDDDLTLTYSMLDDDEDVVTSSIVWKVNDQRVSSLDNLSTVPSIATRMGDTWEAHVLLSDGFDSNLVVSSSMFITSDNSAPTITSLTIIPATPTSSQDIEVLWSIDDEEGDEEEVVEIAWLKTGELVADQTTSTLSSSQTSKGETWEVMVRVFDGFGWSNWSTSEMFTIQNSLPTISTIDFDSLEVASDSNVSLTYTATDVDGDPIEISSILWTNGEQTVDSGTQQTLSYEFTSKGESWYAMIQLTDGVDVGPSFSSTPVTIVNSKPLVSIQFDEEQIAKQALTPNIDIFDEDGDAIDVTITWYKNGFRDGSLDNQTSVPAQKIGSAQEWKLLVQATDIDGETVTIEASVIIQNAPPQANIEHASNTIWLGESITFDGSTSMDSDGTIVGYRWYLDSGEGEQILVGTEAMVTFLASDSFDLMLVVTDSSGATAEIVESFTSIQGPSVSQVNLVHQQEKFTLSWQWDGPETMFRIYEDGRVIGETTELTYQGRSSLAVEQSFSIVPIVDGQELQAGQAQSELVDFSKVELDQEPSSFLAMGISVLILGLGTLLMLMVLRKEVVQ
jgi:hypothetical protein